VNPEEVPYEFSSIYEQDKFYPANLVELSQPYILRDFRGVAVQAYPFAYNPNSRILRVYNKLVVKVSNVGIGSENVKYDSDNKVNREFVQIYANHFINYQQTRYDTVEEEGRIVVICYDDFMEAVQPYVDWKNQKGLQTDLYSVTEVGSSASAIKSFIQEQYDMNNGLAYVQLVGDAPQVPPFNNSGDSDPSYTLLEGGDNYPEIFIGRFSAENVDEVETQVERTIHYERDVVDGDWQHKGMGVASNQGTGDDNEYDYEHEDNIRQKLLNYTYTEVDQIYDPSGTATDVANGLNAGRSIVNYTGHGNTTSWGSTGFSNSNVNQLVNDNTLPFISSVACLNGNFANSTCFAEAWVRATNYETGAPTGAIAVYASTISQSWNPPMRAQDHAVDLLVGYDYSEDEPIDQKFSIGGLWFNGSMNMIDVYGYSGAEEFFYWTIFGDASLRVRTDTPEAMNVSHLPTLFIGLNTFEVNTGVEGALVSLTNEDHEIIGSGYTDATGHVTLELVDPPVVPTDLTLTVTATNKQTYIGTVSVIPNEGPYVIVNDYTIDAGGDELIEYGETVTVDVTLENVGSEDASGVNMELAIDDTYITLTDNTEDIGTISAGAVNDFPAAFTFTVANNVPDQYNFILNSSITDGTEVWESTMSMIAYAPVLEVATNITVDDGDNGRLDPGDTADLYVPIENLGGAAATNISALLSSEDELITINSDSDEIAELLAAGSAEVMFNVSVAEEAEIGHVANFMVDLTADNDYASSSDFGLNIGLCLEDFESGSFVMYPWEFDGAADWFLTESSAYEGLYAAQSGDISDNQESTLEVELDVIAAAEMSFWVKVSSEGNWDYLRFYVDNNQLGEWSGEVGWTEQTYEIEAGNHTFKWSYEKDTSVSSGSDCGWVDYIIFPPVIVPAAPQMAVDIDAITMEMGQNETGTEAFEISNVGGGSIDYSISIYNPERGEKSLEGSTLECDTSEFMPGENATWTFTAYNGSTDNEWIEEIYIQFPAGVTVESATDFSGSSPIIWDGSSGNGVETAWIEGGYIGDDATGTAAVEVSIDAGFSGDVVLEYTFVGDVYGDPPHEVSGELTIVSMGEPITWLTVEPSSGSLLGGQSEEISVNFDTSDMALGNYECSLMIDDGYGNVVEIPVSLVVAESGNEGVLPAVTELQGNYPNPFNPETTINFSLKETGQVKLEVYNIKGQKVKTLVNQEMSAGQHSVLWSGRDDSGNSVSSGVYFFRMTNGRYTSTRKMILMK
jgi:hypothetical protein